MAFDLYRVDNAFRDYILKRLLPQLKSDASSCNVIVPLYGRKSCLRLIKGMPDDEYAVRIFLTKDKKSIRQLYRAYDLLKKNDIPSPRLVDYAMDFASSGFTFLTEDFLRGKAWYEITPDENVSELLGELLAKLHSVESDQCGALSERRLFCRNFRRSQFRRVKHRIHRIKKYLPAGIKRYEIRQVKDWFGKSLARLDEIKKYQLVHDKLNRGNLLYNQKERKLYLLDFATLGFCCRAKDLVQAEIDLLNNEKNLIRVFHEIYFSHFSPEIKEKYLYVRPFYHAYFHLSKSASSLRRDYNNRKQEIPYKLSFYHDFSDNWQNLQGVMKENPPLEKAEKTPGISCLKSFRDRIFHKFGMSKASKSPDRSDKES